MDRGNLAALGPPVNFCIRQIFSTSDGHNQGRMKRQEVGGLFKSSNRLWLFESSVFEVSLLSSSRVTYSSNFISVFRRVPTLLEQDQLVICNVVGVFTHGLCK